jgi:hypothetical protein
MKLRQMTQVIEIAEENRIDQHENHTPPESTDRYS